MWESFNKGLAEGEAKGEAIGKAKGEVKKEKEMIAALRASGASEELIEAALKAMTDKNTLAD